MKKLLFILAILTVGCTAEEVKTECECREIDYITNPYGTTYAGSNRPSLITDCKMDGEVIFTDSQIEEIGVFYLNRIVECE